jgi:hypothetical protein
MKKYKMKKFSFLTPAALFPSLCLMQFCDPLPFSAKCKYAAKSMDMHSNLLLPLLTLPDIIPVQEVLCRSPSFTPAALGIEAPLITVEVHLSNGLPA